MSGIEKDITNNNDFERVHNESFPFYEYDTKIIPVNVLNGPKNPVITSQTQRGKLKSRQETVSITSTGTFNVIAEVPINKKWIVKGFEIYANGPGFTVSFIKLRIEVDHNITIKSGNTSELNGIIDTDILLNPGDRVIGLIGVSSFTSVESMLMRLLYQEIAEA